MAVAIVNPRATIKKDTEDIHEYLKTLVDISEARMFAYGIGHLNEMGAEGVTILRP